MCKKGVQLREEVAHSLGSKVTKRTFPKTHVSIIEQAILMGPIVETSVTEGTVLKHIVAVSGIWNLIFVPHDQLDTVSNTGFLIVASN